MSDGFPTGEGPHRQADRGRDPGESVRRERLEIGGVRFRRREHHGTAETIVIVRPPPTNSVTCVAPKALAAGIPASVPK
ncbi:hypothetical protein [Amycolatopsis orientalis]|uniref:hypothetical protein n=1 Tax=Amycolatopsis orientalis TaxID=31958 RepID=UPI000A5AD3BC|nr:hypothetical protein [Amycolatopsis orientalis]